MTQHVSPVICLSLFASCFFYLFICLFLFWVSFWHVSVMMQQLCCFSCLTDSLYLFASLSKSSIVCAKEMKIQNLKQTTKGSDHELHQQHFLLLRSDATDALTDITTDICYHMKPFWVIMRDISLCHSLWLLETTIVVQPISCPWMLLHLHIQSGSETLQVNTKRCILYVWR